MMEEVKNKSPEILDVKLGVLTDETLGCLSREVMGIFYRDVSTFYQV